MKVFVAGASGFVGTRLVRKLATLEPGSVLAGLRRENAAFAASGIEQRVMDITDAEGLIRAMAGSSHVVNCIMGSPEVMVSSTTNLLAAAREAGVKRFVHFSSIAVFGSREGLIGDDASFAEDVDAYGAAKIECERLVRASGLEAVILRPALIHGPGSEQWTRRVGALLEQRRLGDLGPAGDGICNLILVDDVVQAAIAALAATDAPGRAFNLADPEPVTWNRYLMDFARAIGATPVHRLPGWQLRLERKLIAFPLKIMAILRGKLRLSRLPLPEAITPGFARLFSQQVRYDATGSDHVLRFPRTTYGEGIALSARWFRENCSRQARLSRQ